MVDEQCMRFMSRTGWDVGKWDDEPDMQIFTTKSGYVGFMQRNDDGAWCGYVLIPKCHPFHEMVLSSRSPSPLHDLEVHGGVTWSGYVNPPADCGIGRSWVIGFDCGHAFDIKPGVRMRLAETFSSLFSPMLEELLLATGQSHGEAYRSAEYVRENVERLGQQLKNAAASAIQAVAN